MNKTLYEKYKSITYTNKTMNKLGEILSQGRETRKVK